MNNITAVNEAVLPEYGFAGMERKQEQIRHLFQQEFSRMVAVISNRYGLRHIETAEDIVSETFLIAAELWAAEGVPENPEAWLYTVAKRKTLYQFRREKIFDEKVLPELISRQDNESENDELNFSLQNIKDSQLQMLFAVCDPAIASEAQIGLALRILCGFGIGEIAEAFLSNKETINKRLYRAKEKLRTENIRMEIPQAGEIPDRLDSVLHIIYLLFNEGYYSKTQNRILRKDLCLEAMRLGFMLTEYPPVNMPKTNALMALMCFHASRFDARQTTGEEMILYEQQNEKLWDTALIKQGMHFLKESVQGDEISSYHLEARIAWWHCMKQESSEKWEDILRLYDQLLKVNYSPSVALNRVFALYKVKGPQTALAEAEELSLEDSHFYFVLLGELYKEIDNKKAELHFQKALSLAKTRTEKNEIAKKISKLV